MSSIQSTVAADSQQNIKPFKYGASCSWPSQVMPFVHFKKNGGNTTSFQLMAPKHQPFKLQYNIIQYSS